MSDPQPQGRILIVISAGLFAALMIAGVMQSMKVEHRPPAVDLLATGARNSVERLVAAKDFDRAIEQLKLQTRIQPYDAGVHEDLGTLLASQARFEEARDQFRVLVKLRPDYSHGFLLLGSTYLDLREPERAMRCFAEAQHLQPDDPVVLNSAGVALMQLGDINQAAACFAEAVRLKPDFQDAQINLNRIQRAMQSQPSQEPSREK